MKETIMAIGLSVTASVLTLVLLAITKILWNYWLANVWLRYTCRHLTDLQDIWESKYTDNNGIQIDEQLDLKQYGWKIKGTFQYCATNLDNTREQKKFSVQGILRNDHLTAFYWNTDRKQKGCGSFTLSLVEDGAKLKGNFAWYDTSESLIKTGDYEMKRKC